MLIAYVFERFVNGKWILDWVENQSKVPAGVTVIARVIVSKVIPGAYAIACAPAEHTSVLHYRNTVAALIQTCRENA